VFRQLFDTASSTYTYLLACERTLEAVLIDPVHAQFRRDVALIELSALRLAWVLDTHVHADHITGAGALRERFGVRIAVSEGCEAGGYDQGLHDGDRLAFGDEAIRVIATPGHTRGSLCFLWRDRLFTGDTLLIGGCGRTDFQGGDAGRLYDAVTSRLFTLPDATRVCPGHDYRLRTESTIGEERLHNPRLAGRSRDEFIALMTALDLPPPALLDVAVSANRQAGWPAEQAPAAPPNP
jgi:sulfur dioxygenase